MLGPSSHLVGAIDKLPFISCAKNTTGAHCCEAKENQRLTRLNSTEHNPLQSRGVTTAACCDYLLVKAI